MAGEGCQAIWTPFKPQCPKLVELPLVLPGKPGNQRFANFEKRPLCNQSLALKNKTAYEIHSPKRGSKEGAWTKPRVQSKSGKGRRGQSQLSGLLLYTASISAHGRLNIYFGLEN